MGPNRQTVRIAQRRARLVALTWAAAAIAITFAAESKANTFRWEPPITREDGQPLNPRTELSAYRLYCGAKQTELPPTATTRALDASVVPGPGTHVCYITAMDTNGQESQPSNVQEVTWQPAPPSKPGKLELVIAAVPPPAPTGQVIATIDPINDSYTSLLAVDNQTDQPISQFKLAIAGAVIDTLDNPAGPQITVTPDLGGNNDSISTTELTLTFTPALAAGQSATARIDLDSISQPIIMQGQVTFENSFTWNAPSSEGADTDDQNPRLYDVILGPSP